MHRALRGLTFLVFVSALHTPAQQNPATPTPAGLETDWDAAVTLNAIVANTARLLPLLDHADAQAWIQKGASETYAQQLQSAKEQARAVAASAKALAADPAKLSASLELFFRIQGLETMLGSVAEAMRHYQSAADAQALIAATAENGQSRDNFQRYIVNLAAEREREYVVMDQEAQRCRPTASAPSNSGKKKK
jgi:transcriptional regulator of acetoin/glycerol metabolism